MVEGWEDRLRSQGHGVTATSQDRSAWKIHVGDRGELDLTDIPPASLEIRASPTTETLRLVGMPGQIRAQARVIVEQPLLRIEIPDGAVVGALSIVGGGDSIGPVLLDVRGLSHSRGAGPEVFSLHIEGVTVSALHDAWLPVFGSVDIQDGGLTGADHIVVLRLQGKCTVGVRDISFLHVLGESVIETTRDTHVANFNSGRSAVTFRRRAPRADASEVVIEVGSVEADGIVEMDDVTLVPVGGGPWFGALRGRGTVHVKSPLTGLGLFSWGPNTPRLAVERHAFVDGVFGEFVLSRLNGGRIEGMKGFVGPPRLLAIDAHDEHALHGGHLLRVDVQEMSLDHVRRLAELARFVPSTSTFAAFRPVWRRGGGILPARPQGAFPDLAHPGHTAQLFEEIARVAERSGGSGSITTKAWYAAQRARLQALDSRWERLLLGLYRLVGFGERPGPALVALAVALLGMTMAVQSQAHAPLVLDSWAAYRRFFRVFGEVVLSMPLFVLRLGSDSPEFLPDTPTGLKVIGRLLTTVPLGFALLALKRFVRARPL